MKTILCYGDSNTWGAAPLDAAGNTRRYGPAERWAGVMRAELGAGYTVIEEGLNGRTTVFDDPVEGAHKNGRSHLVPCLESHAPLDLVIVMLGTNDLKARFSATPFDIAAGAGKLLELIAVSARKQQGPTPPRTLLVSPAPLARLSGLAEMFEGGAAKSARLAGLYRAVAAERGSAFFDAGSVIRSSDGDGIHLDVDQHAVLGRALAAEARAILGG